ncbi:MAG: ATP-binding cassette domain-containing protein [bacterium]|nr:ATP-binding cassette domain-containing protein [bacterium]
MALINLNDVTIHFGGPLLLDRADLQIQRGERVCLLGRNGTGKTTLLKLINGDLEPDKGTIARQQGLRTAHLAQEVPRGISGEVFDIVLGGFQKNLEAGDGWEIHRQAETIITRMHLDADARFETLSAGMKRRVLLARALVSRPDILLLDEPTNHLDIDAITWLEEFLLKYEGTLLFVTHDRMLVKKLSNRILELDRGLLSSWDCDYQAYLERKEAALEAEKGQWAQFDKKLAKEEEWIRQGIKARRTRNEGRVGALLKMREERRARREQMGAVKIRMQEAGRSGRLVTETEKISFAYEKNPVIRDLSTLIMRGDRVGIVGPNGSGKTTLLRVLLGRLQPQRGIIRHGTNLEIIYFDQLRGQLDEEKTVLDNVADGNDRVVIDGKTRHIIGYLQDFLFTPDRSRTPVKVLSGGERNRLMLAKLFVKPSNLLVLDEPTNDLDIETLELLEEMLMNYSGTLLLVSHDRAFLNNVVTSTLVLEGEGRVNEYVGGYDDWLRQRPPVVTKTGEREKNRPKEEKPAKQQPRPRKLTNKERQELETLPRRIEELEAEQEQLYKTMADPEFYKQEGTVISGTTARLETLKHELIHAYQRWEELESI